MSEDRIVQNVATDSFLRYRDLEQRLHVVEMEQSRYSEERKHIYNSLDRIEAALESRAQRSSKFISGLLTYILSGVILAGLGLLALWR